MLNWHCTDQRDDLLNCENNDGSRAFSLSVWVLGTLLLGYGNVIRGVDFVLLENIKTFSILFVIIAIVDMSKRELRMSCVVVAHEKIHQKQKQRTKFNEKEKEIQFRTNLLLCDGKEMQRTKEYINFTQ